MSERPVFENNLLLKPLVRQFDSVGMLLVALVLFRQDFFQPLCLLFCDPLIYRFWVVADEEFLPATVTPERSHLLEAYGFLAATLFYRHCLHVLILDELAILLAATSFTSDHLREFAMGLRPTHGYESALPRFIDSKRVATRLSTECKGPVRQLSPSSLYKTSFSSSSTFAGLLLRRGQNAFCSLSGW